mmetsp:Transcript_6784/g.24092  ORF Transcript_6784/g.24092 Transcript_6784/m.24092 type:complete len:99 (-) Transcript_6784:964-1260(-)
MQARGLAKTQNIETIGNSGAMYGQDVVLGKMKYKKDAILPLTLVLYCFLNSLQHLLPMMSDACKVPCRTIEGHWTASPHRHMQVHCSEESVLQRADWD